MADNESKKRKKLINDIEDDDHEVALTEEQKIDKFYALIRSMREARDRLMMINQSNRAKNKDDHHDQDQDQDQLKYVSTKRKKVEEEKEEHISFQCEDFIDSNREVLFKIPNNSVTFGTTSSSSSIVLVGAGSDKKEDHQKITTIDGLDLTLSL